MTSDTRLVLAFLDTPAARRESLGFATAAFTDAYKLFDKPAKRRRYAVDIHARALFAWLVPQPQLLDGVDFAKVEWDDIAETQINLVAHKARS